MGRPSPRIVYFYVPAAGRNAYCRKEFYCPMLQAGFSRMDVTPPLGTHLAGNFRNRPAEGILDPLLATCVAFRDADGNTALVYSIDNLYLMQSIADVARKTIREATGVPEDAIFLACTHIHTGPCMVTKIFPHNPVYNAWFYEQLGTLGALALQDLAPAKLLTAEGRAEGIAFIRRFRMKDGSIRTNPGALNPDIKEPIGTPDETVRLVRVVREGREEIDIVNFQVHPDVVGGKRYTADYPGFVRRTLEGALPGVKVMYLNGCQGDTNHLDVSLDPKSPDRAYFPSGRPNGYERARYMGQVIAGAVLQVWMKALPAEGPDRVRYCLRDLDTPANMPDPAELPEAERIIKLYEEGREDALTAINPSLITVLGEAFRKVRLAKRGDPMLHLHMTAVAVGGVAFAGFHGEPFTDIGRGTRSASPFGTTLTCCLVNGGEGYLPMYSAFAEGGYESRSSNFTPGVAEQLIAGQAKILKELYEG